MQKTYPVAFRERTLALLDDGRSLDEVADLIHVGTATLKRWRRRVRETGTVAPRRSPGRPARITAYHQAALRAQVRTLPDATLAEHCAQWEATTGIRVSTSTMCRVLDRLDLPRKKNE